jgi:Asp-tRNA(Asn)/Glu-tRNA(Gln) amidotransferase A subunit family amidase
MLNNPSFNIQHSTFLNMFITPALLVEIADALRNNTIDLVAYLNQLCDRIDTIEPHIEALLPEENRRQRLIREARDLQRRFPNPENRPPLYGVPVGVKDIFRVDGFPTKAGSQLPSELFEGKEATCVTRLKQAGALILGKTVTTEFAYFEPGPTHNPHNLNHTPGGSSSGSAAGVACGFFPLALGTQTIGSIIRPAAFCGIVGFKPSYNRIPVDGLLIFSKSADHVGLLTQDVAGMELAASILCKDWKSPSPNPSPQGRGTTSPLPLWEGQGEGRFPVLGVPEGKYLEQASAEGLSAFAEQFKTLQDAGYTIKRMRVFDDIDAINHRHRLMTVAEAAQEHAVWFSRYQELYRPKTEEAILKGQQVTGEELNTARAGQLQLRQQLETMKTQAGIDIWISPAATSDAPEGLQATGDPIMNLPWTHAGLPTVTIPAGISQRGLPLGLQFITSFMDDEKLMAWAKQLTAAGAFRT